jgi:hypothetical protein
MMLSELAIPVRPLGAEPVTGFITGAHSRLANRFAVFEAPALPPGKAPRFKLRCAP